MEQRTPEDILHGAGGTIEQQIPPPNLAEYLSAEAWLDRDFPEPERFLGDLIISGVRMFIVGRTGLGKTMLGLAMAVAMASGSAFLHWAAGRACRVLYIDGEMPGALLRERLRDALRRAGNPDLAGRLIIFGRDIEDEAARLCPALGAMPPLNSEAGHKWLLALLDGIGGIDAIFLDNVMSLIDGIAKEEESWKGATPLVDALSRRRIAQVWLDHTGWDGSHQYGTSTKSWRFDAVALMAALTDEQRAPYELAFTLSFDPPTGKARRRTPLNWQDFAPVTIRLADDRWTSEPADRRSAGGSTIKPSRRPYYDALISAITRSADGPGRATVETWQTECMHSGLIEPVGTDETWQRRDARFRGFRAAKHDLIAAAWIAIADDVVTDLHGRWS